MESTKFSKELLTLFESPNEMCSSIYTRFEHVTGEIKKIKFKKDGTLNHSIIPFKRKIAASMNSDNI